MHAHSRLTPPVLLHWAAFAFLALCLAGCPTKHDVEELSQKLDRIEARVVHLDSTNAAVTEADRKLRNDMQQTVGELQRQIAQLLENYNELLAKVDALGRARERVVEVPNPDSSDQVGGVGSACDTTYDESFLLVRRQKYDDAIAGFRKYLANCSTHVSVSNAWYWMGECYYSQEKYKDAAWQFGHLLEKYPDSPNARTALYKLARCKQELRQKKEATKLFKRVIDEYGGSYEADQARDRLKELR